MYKSVLKYSILMIFVCLSISTAVSADQDLNQQILDRNKDATASHDRLIFSSAEVLGAAGVSTYWMIYGQWPESFQDVRDAGLVQVELKSATQQVVDMDDGAFDFETDCHFMPSRDDISPIIATLEGKDLENVLYDEVEKPQTYSEMFGNVPERIQNDFLDLLSETNRINLVGIAHICNRGLYWHKLAKGNYPETWDEFLESGFSPVNLESVNPLTGELLYADGRPDNLLFSNKGGSNPALVFVTDCNGEVKVKTN